MGSTTRIDVFHFFACAIPACASQRLGSCSAGLSAPPARSRSRRHRVHEQRIMLSLGRKVPTRFLHSTFTSGRSDNDAGGAAGTSEGTSAEGFSSAAASAFPSASASS